MASKTEDSSNIINPLSGTEATKKLLNRIILQKGILHPKEEFKPFITDESREKLQLLLCVSFKQIKYHFDEKKFSICKYYLDQIIYLH